MTTLSDFVNSGASNQAQVDANTNAIKALAGRNKIINGHMVISQRAASFAIPTGNSNTYTIDRWVFSSNSEAAYTITQDADTPFPYKFNSFKVLVTTLDNALAASQTALISQYIEGHNIRLLFNRTFTLSFFVKASKVGKYGVAFRNTDFTQVYAAEYNIDAANTWEKKTITVVGGLPSVGTWDISTGVGLRVSFYLAGASNITTSNLNTWVSSGQPITSNQVNLLDTVNATFFLTGVQLELGEQSTEFEIRSISDEILTCQRYYCTSVPGFKQFLYKKLSWGTATVRFPVQMRAAPVITPLNLSALGDTAGSAIAYSAAGFCYTFTNGNEGSVEFNWTASAEL